MITEQWAQKQPSKIKNVIIYWFIIINAVKNTIDVNLISNKHCLKFKQVMEFFVFLCFL